MDLEENSSARVLTTLPTVVERVFRYLNARDLISCSRVCQEWKRTYLIVKRRRQDPLVIEERTSESCGTNPRERAIETQNLIKKIQDIMDSSYMEPNFGIVFVCNVDYTEDRVIENSLRIGDASLMNFYISYKNLGSIIYVPYEFPPNSPRISALFFPDYVPGVEFYSFNIVQKFPPALDLAEAVFNVTKIPQDRRVKCLLLFKKLPSTGLPTFIPLDCGIEIMNYYMAREKNKMAMGGAQSTYYYIIEDPECHVGIGLAITGDQFEAASLFLTEDISTEDAILEKLESLKKGIVLRERTFALLFSSWWTGEQRYDSPNIESQCFKEVFPDVPLIGMKTDGLFDVRDALGTTYLPASEFTELPGNDTFIHNNCSVFVILTWGK